MRNSMHMLLALALLAAAAPGGGRAQDGDGVDSAVHAPNLPQSAFYLPRNRLVEIELTEAIDTAAAQRDQVFHYRVTRSVKGDGGVVVQAGAEGTGTVLETRKGTKTIPARLHLNFGEVPSVEGRPVKLGFTEPARKANEQLAGLTAVIGGYFENGSRRVRIEAGTKILAAVEYPYGTRRIRTGEEGGSYHLFRTDPVDRD